VEAQVEPLRRDLRTCSEENIDWTLAARRVDPLRKMTRPGTVTVIAVPDPVRWSPIAWHDALRAFAHATQTEVPFFAALGHRRVDANAIVRDS
jgi:hypothetical protein